MSGRGGGRARPVAVIAAFGGLAVACVMLAGPMQWGVRDWMARVANAPLTVIPGQLATPSPSPSSDTTTPVGADGSAFWVLVAALTLGVVYLLWRLLRRLRARRRRPPHSPLLTDAQPGLFASTASDAQAQDAAPEMLRGIAGALRILDEPRAPRDAVVAAWLGVEESAERSGIHRLSAETPSEFANRVLTLVGADPVAAAELLSLYQEVRFGDHAVDEHAVSIARKCLIRLQESWHEPTGVSR